MDLLKEAKIALRLEKHEEAISLWRYEGEYAFYNVKEPFRAEHPVRFLQRRGILIPTAIWTLAWACGPSCADRDWGRSMLPNASGLRGSAMGAAGSACRWRLSTSGR